jgi:hypothetical protein
MNLKDSFKLVTQKVSRWWSEIIASPDILSGVDTARVALDKLYAASVGEGKSEDILRYNLQFASARDLKLAYFHPQINEYGNEKVLLEPYRNLTITELTIMTEVVSVSHTDLLVYVQTGRKRYNRATYLQFEIMREFFSDKRPSDNLKFGAASLYLGDLMNDNYIHRDGGTALWLADYKGGEYLPHAALAYLNNTADEFGVTEDIEEFSNRILITGLDSALNNYDISVVVKIVETLSPAFMDHRRLELLYATLPFRLRSAGINQALAAHARRLYNFGQEIPDEWVLRAIC